jgi:glycosyltransferase involved in cell wall biosynthesis
MSRRILYVQYTNPAGYPPLEHSSRILAECGWDVLFLGTGAAGASDHFEFPPHPRIQVRRLAFIAPGWRQKLHFLWFHLWVLFGILVWRSRWIYASDLMACPIGWLCTFLPGIRVIYHEHDTPVQQSVVNGPWSVVSRFLLWSRHRLACRAELCVLPNQRRIDAFRTATGTSRRVLCVWNCPAKEELPVQRPADAPGEFVVFYHGSIVPARLPVTVIQALARLPAKVILRVAGYETDRALAHLKRLRAEARQLGVEKRFEYCGALATRNELLERCRKADVGLALLPLDTDDLNEQAMAGASNKPFDYMACGVPLLVSDLPDWRMMFVKPGYGLACNPENPESIARTLLWCIENPDESRRMGNQGCDRIRTEWNYETQFAPVLNHLGLG